MQVNLNSQLYTGTTFRNAYMVQGVDINGKYYGQNKHKALLHEVADQLSSSMHFSTLSPKVQKIVKQLFPDFLTEPSVCVACNPGPAYERRINILSGYHAKEYRDIFKTSDDAETKKDIGEWTLKRIMRDTGNKKIIISAEKKDGKIEITDIVRVAIKDGKVVRKPVI